MPEHLCVDVSQMLGRRPWTTNGTLRTPRANNQYVYGGDVLPAPALFEMVGWPRLDLTVPTSLSDSAISTLIGNMMALPCVGAVCLAGLGVVPVGQDQALDFRCRARV